MNDNLGIFPGVPFEEYAKIPALNGSSLVYLRKSPMHYRYMLDNPKPPTEAMTLGTATHQLILEPHRVGDFAVWGELPEEKVRNGKVWEVFKSNHADKLIVTRAQRDSMVGMAVSARKNPPLLKYANAKGETEVVIVWREATLGGRLFKGRIDKLIDGGRTVFDLKTCRDCAKYRFGNNAYKLGYHIKMALYWLGVKALTGKLPTLVLGAIESLPPHESAVYRVTSDALLQGCDDLTALIGKLSECEASGTWPAAETEELELTLPTYAYGQPGDESDISDLALVEE